MQKNHIMFKDTQQLSGKVLKLTKFKLRCSKFCRLIYFLKFSFKFLSRRKDFELNVTFLSEAQRAAI